MATWENDLYVNGLWLDTSDPSLNVLKKFDFILNDWVQTSGAYSTAETDAKIAALQRNGTTAQRPSDAVVGTVYFDTTLGKPVWCKSIGPIVWVDSTGTVV